MSKDTKAYRAIVKFPFVPQTSPERAGSHAAWLFILSLVLAIIFILAGGLDWLIGFVVAWGLGYGVCQMQHFSYIVNYPIELWDSRDE